MARKVIYRKPQSKGTAIVGDGLCEKLYFEQMKEAEQLILNIKPQLPNSSGSWSTVFKTVDKLLLNEEYEQIYCLIDYDKVISNNEMQKYLNRKNELEKTKRVTVYECNPCFEMWFLVHFERKATSFDDCESVAKYLKSKKHIADYDKTKEYYNKKRIYEYLNPKQSTAILNAHFLEQNRKDNGPKYPRAEVYKLIKLLKGIKEEDEKLRK
jgi:hypothetical protein